MSKGRSKIVPLQLIVALTLGAAMVAVAVLADESHVPVTSSSTTETAQDTAKNTGDPSFEKLTQTGSQLAGATLSSLRAGIASPHKAQRDETIRRILAATRGDAVRLHAFLHRDSNISPADYRRVLQAIGAAVPDGAGRFADHVTSDELDWLSALCKVEPRRLLPALIPAYNEAVLSVALMRGLVASKHPDAALSLLRFAYRHQGAFRDECGRQIRRLGVYAVPGLLRARVLRDPQVHRVKRYAAYQLDRMELGRADRALQLALPELRAEIIHAYGEVQDPAAVNAVLGYTAAEQDNVRRAARWATLRYVSGRAPKVEKRRLNLSGGRKTQEEKALFYTYRQLARHALLEQVVLAAPRAMSDTQREALRKQLEQELTSRALAERLFAGQDQVRESRQRAELGRGQKLARQGKLESAIAIFDQLLAADPFRGARAEMAVCYWHLGLRRAATGAYREASRLLLKGIHLAPAARFARKARAMQAMCEAHLVGLSSPGGERFLRRALAIDPSLAAARDALAQSEFGHAQATLATVAFSAIFAGALMLVFVALLRKNTRRHPRWPTTLLAILRR